MLNSQYDLALRYAHDLHRRQKRKGTEIPYISHLLTVSALVIEHGGTEVQAIAGLLHDAAEDQGGRKTLEDVRAQFGDAVAQIVADCTDSLDETADQKRGNWQQRKEAHLATLAAVSKDSMLVALADKVHNAEATLYDYRFLGKDLWSRFNGGEKTPWYYTALGDLFAKSYGGRLADRLVRAASEMSKPL